MKTFLSPLHIELINQGLWFVDQYRKVWSQEDRERGQEAIEAIRILLNGSGTREAVIAAEKRARKAVCKYENRRGNPSWIEEDDSYRLTGEYHWYDQKTAILLVSSVARLAASEYPKDQAREFKCCVMLSSQLSDSLSFYRRDGVFDVTYEA